MGECKIWCVVHMWLSSGLWEGAKSNMGQMLAQVFLFIDSQFLYDIRIRMSVKNAVAVQKKVQVNVIGLKIFLLIFF